jgi:hypothetical protein
VRAAVLAVGIALYRNGPLPGCDADAEKVIEACRARFRGQALYLPLRDALATAGNLELSLRAAARAVPPGGVIYFFVSGHGVTNRGPTTAGHGRQAILLSDGPVCAARLKELLDAIVPPDRLLVMAFDTCFSDGMRGAVEAPNRVLLAASDEDSTSVTAAGLGYGGYLSAAFVDCILGLADADHDGVTTLEEVRWYVEQFFAKHCPRALARDTRGRAVSQHPAVERGTVPLGAAVIPAAADSPWPRPAK